MQVAYAMMTLTGQDPAARFTSVACRLHRQDHAKQLTVRHDANKDLGALGERSWTSNATFPPIPEIGASKDVVQPGIENSEPLVKEHQQPPWFAPYHTEKLLEAWFLGQRVDMQYLPQKRGYRDSCLSSGKLKVFSQFRVVVDALHRVFATAVAPLSDCCGVRSVCGICNPQRYRDGGELV